MAQFNTNCISSSIGTPEMNDELFFETYVKIQESAANSASCAVMHHSDEIKCNMAMIFKLKKNLESLKDVLSDIHLNDDEFHKQKETSDELKMQLEFLLNQTKNHKLSSTLDRKIGSLPSRAKKKKRKQKSKKLECKQIKSFIKPRVLKKKPILKDDIENLCRSNDIKLSEVISKRNEAQKYLNFLQDMAQLRKVKVAKAKVEGNAYSDEANAVIEKMIDGMKDQWMELMNKYNSEERNLKEMIKDDNSNNSSHTAKLHYWERILFGDDICRTPYDGLDENLKKYYALLRCMWDESIDDVEGVNLPLGWVMPQESSNPAWNEYCQAD